MQPQGFAASTGWVSFDDDSTFPSFAALHGGGPAFAAAPANVRSPSLSAGVGGPGTSPPALPMPGASAESGNFIHRLQRPPTSALRGAAGPPAANPFGSDVAPPAVLPSSSSNPFASSVNPLGATAAARSLDPFADLSLKPALPRPPPMAASKGSPPSASSVSPVSPPAAPGAVPMGAIPAAPGLAAVAPAGAGMAGAVSGQAAVTGATAMTASGAGLGLRRPPADGLLAAGQGPAAPAVTAPAAPQSMFPSFAALYSQQPQSPAAAAAAAPPHRAVALAATVPAVPAAATAAAPSPPAGLDPSMQPLAVRAPQLSAPQPVPEAVLVQGFGVVDTTSFSSFHPPAAKPSPPSSQGQPNLSRSEALMPSLPPPPYSLADKGTDLASSLLMGPTSCLPTPPPYTEALGMPDAQPPPPPSYEEAVALPSAAEPALDRAVVPLRHSNTHAWTAFDDADGCAAGPPQSHDPPSAAAAPSSSPYRFAASARSAAQPPPDQICVEVRLPPLKPKDAACPSRLVSGMGLLFAAPGTEGVAALQWWLQPGSGPRFAMSVGSGTGSVMLAPRCTEDADSAPAAAVLLAPPVSDVQPTCCMLLDDVSGSLWTGHKDGRVVRWSVEPGRVAVYEHHWRAHVRGKITSMTLTPWGDLWTASSGGTIRAWQYQGGLPASRPPIKLFECRRCKPAMGSAARTNAQRPHSKARLLCLGPSGRVVWSAGRTGMALWAAYDGEFLGALTPGLQQDSNRQGGASAAAAGGAGVYAGDTGALYRESGAAQQQVEINPRTVSWRLTLGRSPVAARTVTRYYYRLPSSRPLLPQGLEAALITRPFLPRQLLESFEEAEAGDPDLDLGQQVIKGLAGAAKLAAKLGKKIRQNFTESTGVGAATEAGPANELYGTGTGSRGKVVALIPGLDQSVYVAYRRGVLEKYSEWGMLIWTRDYGRRVELYSAILVGSRLWLGCGDGAIRTASAASGELSQSWKAHDFPVVRLAHDTGSTGRGSALVYSLSENGSVRGWPAVAPPEAQRLAWRNGLLPCLQPHRLTILAATWNVNETRPASQSLRKWLEPAAKADIVSISLQEVEVGTSSVAWDAAVTLLSKSMLALVSVRRLTAHGLATQAGQLQERGNQNAQWWSTELAAALLAATGGSWERVALRQMSGLVIVVFCRAELQQHVGEVATANVACGVMGVGGNKGAVAVSMSVFRRRVMFVCSHFAAHQEHVEERNENYNKIVRLLHFDNTSKSANQVQLLRQQQQLHQVSEVDIKSDFDGSVNPNTAPAGAGSSEAEDDGHGPGLSDAALLVWAGDFNYRIKGTYAEVCEWSCSGALPHLFQLDQCRIEMEKGVIFRGLREPLPQGHPVFVPTYKYDKGIPHRVIPSPEPGARGRLELPFDSSEKQRVPAWTDRVFYRGSRAGSLDVAEEEVVVGIDSSADYNCVLDVTDSDHKPVFALLQVQLPGYEQEQKRRHSLTSALAVHQAVLSPQGGVGLARQQTQLVQVSAS
ncbi:hypothetical protein VOLCADRAFT_88385, partial [Volvox carteri f. nagariensis]